MPPKKQTTPPAYKVEVVDLPTIRVTAGTKSFDVTRDQAMKIVQSLATALNVQAEPVGSYRTGYNHALNELVSAYYFATPTNRHTIAAHSVLRAERDKLAKKS